MAEQKHRPLSTNDREIEILKRTFASSDGTYPLLKMIRNLFLGFPIPVGQVNVIKAYFKDPEVKLALRKKIYPIISGDMEIGEESDYWFGTESEIIGRGIDEVHQVLKSKQICLEMLTKAFKLLDEPQNGTIDLSYIPSSGIEGKDAIGIELLARNKYVKTVVTGLTIIKIIAGQKNETVEEAKKRLMQDSTK